MDEFFIGMDKRQADEVLQAAFTLLPDEAVQIGKNSSLQFFQFFAIISILFLSTGGSADAAVCGRGRAAFPAW